ncbi:MAG: AMP-binding protein [Gammaproteobacteria bacterium]|nr:AMP-binding protein [Gammaproteobacteria bacterium]MBU1723963.1 AMP-binding protein [Gammaproteobacteria bacterium]MBU2007156.1 AMP-binding protein [Gammaproteobacteria bacterium]
MGIHHRTIYRHVSLSPTWLERRVDTLCVDLQQDGIKPGDTLITDGSPLPALLLTHAAERLGCRLTSFDPTWPETLREGFIRAARTRSPQIPPDTRLVLATSGSSGQPKAVLLTAGNLHSNAVAVCQQLEVSARDVWLCCLPLTHSGGLAILHRCAVSGAALLLHDWFDPEQVLREIQHYRVSGISLVPSMLQRLLAGQDAFPPPKSLRFALIGGAPLSARLAEQAIQSGWPICPTYGMTETCSMVSVCYPPPASWQPGQAGQVLGHLEVGFGEGQRIRVRGSSIMVGYAYPEQPFTPHPSGVWLETGDAGHLDASGQLVVEGRLDDVIISGGENVHPRQVEECLLQHPAVTGVMVGGKPDEQWGNVLVAAFTGEVGEVELESWCRQHLHGAFRPRHFIKLDRLPLTANHKPDYRLLFS